MSDLTLRATSAIKSHILDIAPTGSFPNSGPSKLPVVLYHPFDNIKDEGRGSKVAINDDDALQACEGRASSLNPSDIEGLVSKHGFEPSWRYGMFPFDHFHSNVHELLVPYKGHATLMLGTTTKLRVQPGDVLLLPAGMAHRCVKSSPDYSMVGSYPKGVEQWDICRGGESGVEERIKALGKGGVSVDPIYGERGGTPVGEAWDL